MDVIATSARALADRAVAAARTLTHQGETADEHQVVVERVAYAATEARVIGELAQVPTELAPYARVAAGELAQSLRHRLEPIAGVLGMPEPRHDDAARAAIADAIAPLATREEMRQEGERTRRHFDIVAESLRDDIRLIAESQITLQGDVRRHRNELNGILKNHEKRLTRLEASETRKRAHKKR